MHAEKSRRLTFAHTHNPASGCPNGPAASLCRPGVMTALLAVTAAFAFAWVSGCSSGPAAVADWGWSDGVNDANAADTADRADIDTSVTDDNRVDDAGSDDSAGPDQFDAEPSDADDSHENGAASDSDETVDDAPDAGNPGVDLTGKWAQLHVSSTITRQMLTGEAYSTTVSVSLLTITGKGRTLTVGYDLCDLRIDSTSLAKTVVPQAFVKAIPTVDKPAVIEPVESGETFYQPPFVEVWGADLVDPKNDALPTRADDSRIVDLDEDGKPGLTIQMTGIISGDLYLVQRRIASLRGAVAGPDRFDGLIEFTNEMSFVGSDNQTLLNSLPQRLPDPDPAHSYFRTTRIDAGWGCSDILNNRDGLFER